MPTRPVEDFAPNPTALSNGSEPAPAPADVKPTARAGATWRQWLSGGSPREILARIVHDDPLRVRDHVACELREQAVFLDSDRVHLRALARVARAALRYQGKPEMAVWLAGIVRVAIDELLREDAEVGSAEPGAVFAQLAKPLGLEPASMRRACAAFNRLPATERRAFFDLVVHGRSLDEMVREHHESATEIARRARRALDVVLQPHPVERSAVNGAAVRRIVAPPSEEKP